MAIYCYNSTISQNFEFQFLNNFIGDYRITNRIINKKISKYVKFLIFFQLVYIYIN